MKRARNEKIDLFLEKKKKKEDMSHARKRNLTQSKAGREEISF